MSAQHSFEPDEVARRRSPPGRGEPRRSTMRDRYERNPGRIVELCEDLAEHHEVYAVTGRPSYNPTESTLSRGMISRERHGRVRVSALSARCSLKNLSNKPP